MDTRCLPTTPSEKSCCALPGAKPRGSIKVIGGLSSSPFLSPYLPLKLLRNSCSKKTNTFFARYCACGDNSSSCIVNHGTNYTRRRSSCEDTAAICTRTISQAIIFIRGKPEQQPGWWLHRRHSHRLNCGRYSPHVAVSILFKSRQRRHGKSTICLSTGNPLPIKLTTFTAFTQPTAPF
jgi:hypothetical protein